MNLEIVWQPRTLQLEYWAAVLWMVCLLCLVAAKFLSETKFYEFLRILSTDKYLKSNHDNKPFINWFIIVFYLLQLIVFSFLILIIGDYLEIVDKHNGIHYLKVFTSTSLFFLSKLLVEKIVATSFDIETEANQFNFHKISYQSNVALLLMPFTALVYYTENAAISVVFLIIFAVLLIGFTHIKFVQLHQKWLFSRLFYFILYLCILEIIPYYFIVYWLKEI